MRDHANKRQIRRTGPAGLFAAMFFLPACTPKTPPPATDTGTTPEAAAQPAKLDLWSGVPAIEPEASDIASELTPTAGPKPPPSVSEKIELPFPPPAPPTKQTQDLVEEGPLKVLRTSPTEKAPGLVGSVSAVFNQPMVPLASIDDLKLERSPLTIEPLPKGKFRWLGTQMIAFEPEGRMPYSTTYTAKVVSGETSTLGTKLAKEVKWQFTTPGLEVETYWPGEFGDATLDTPIVIQFNQAIDRDKLLAALRVRGGGGEVSVSAVAPEQWESLPEPFRSQATRGVKERVIVLRPTGALAANTLYTVEIPAGVYGEGPNASKAIKLKVRTFPPLTLSGPKCSQQYYWECNPQSGIQISASTPIVTDPGFEKKVRVTPEVPDLKVTVAGGIHLAGKFRGLGTYTIEVDAGLKDIHGQELKAPYRKTVTLPALDASLQWADRPVDPAVLEPSHSGVLEARATGLTSVEVRARSFEPAEIRKVLIDRHVRYDGEWPEPLKSPTWDKMFDVKDSRVEASILPLDAKALGAGAGKFVLLGARSNQLGGSGWYYRQSLSQVVQITRLGVTAALDSDSGVILVTDIETGAPMAGVELALHNMALDGPVWSGKSGPDGLAELTHGTMYDQPYILARYQGEAAYIPLQQTADNSWGSWMNGNREDEPRIFFYSDRQPYKPGETVHMQGIVREETRGTAGKVQLWRAGTTANYTVTGPRGHEVAKGELKIGQFGTFSFDIPIPADGDTGSYQLHVSSPGGLFSTERAFYHSFEVQQFRAPEFEVKVERPAEAPLLYGDTLQADIKASYLHGAPMVGAAATYTLRRQDSPYRPPGSENEAFTFGQGGSEWWMHGGEFDYGGGFGRGKIGFPMQYGSGMLVRQGNGQTDARGLLSVSHVLAAVETPWGQKTPVPPAGPKSEDPPGASTYTLEANVTDENRQAIAGRATYVVHPASEYAGVRADRSVYRAGERARLEAVVVDVDGKRIAGRDVAVKLVRKETSRAAVQEGGAWQYKYDTVDVEVGSCALVSADAPVNCEIVVDKAGSYDIRALITDPKGHKSLSKHPFYVYGEDAVVWQQDQHRVDMVPDKRTYEPGDKATVLVRSPFDKARGLVVIAREGIVSHHTIEVEGGAATIEVPIDEAQIPQVRASILLVRGRVDVPGAPPGQDLGRPAFAVGQVDLKIAPTRKQIALEVLPEKTEVAPKDTLKLKIKAKDAGGAPQKAAVAVMVVDEGVLSLMGFQTPDPLAFFHHERDPGVSLFDMRQFLVAKKEQEPPPPPAPPPDEAQMVPTDGDAWGGLGVKGVGSGGGGRGYFDANADKAGGMAPTAAAPAPTIPMAEAKAEESRKEVANGPMAKRARQSTMTAALDASVAMNQPISLRSLFATTAYFNAEVTVDASGEATVEIPMPENLTSFRIMAVAVDPDQADRFGSGEASVKVRKPIMLRPSLPRFANFGDKFEASVMVDNQTSEPQAILVGTRGSNVVISGEPTQGVEIPAGESREVRFPMAVDRVGTMRLQFAALSNGGRDATELALPVHYPATRQAFADYGVTTDSISRAIKVPEDALKAFGGLELSMSSTALTGLEDAVDYLIGYRYECTEQLASRLLPIFVLGPVLEQFPIASVSDLAKRQALGAEGVARIQTRQNWDGGFRYWDEAARSSPYLTAWVTFAWLEGKKAGFKVDDGAIDRAMAYLDNFVRYGEATPWGRYYDHTSRAFALWLMSRDGRGSDLFDRVYAKRKEMPLYAHALLLATAQRYGMTGPRDTLLKEFKAKVVENAKTAHFAESAREGDDGYGLQVLMHSDVQTDAIALMALLEVAADDPLLPKVMAGILDSRDPQKGGQWGTTHANAWALLAASRYFTTIEKDVPDYVARVWLDTAFAGERAFKGRSMAVVEQQIPMQKLVEQKPRELLLSKEGPGLLYYRLGLRYAPADLAMKAESQGFTVHRSYEPLAQGGDKPDLESVKKLDDGTWQIKAGALVRVNLTLVAKDRANFVVIDDPLPAGFEGQNAKFSTTLQDVQGGVESQSVDSSVPFFGELGGWWWWRPWWRFDHTEMRDDRMLLFSNHMPAGVYTYSYTARATTIGEFELPPVRAEAMYMPELFGHGASTKVRVVE
ncbi:Ig-like domain-containing alpha-2-macroglobulin family protein [Nannocystis sp. SCPEA4]|uniref:Ig-like domain-containing alpha-2-macroglobulin family protein n=1 Tax=Nannocystis sp. SCPEA4 TaxID=2996787 RepID=UPI0022711A47|nr:Ig-like domain-containing alpha-2-macroglobulin family protein [Nannocystis sp. SCPEA4]MCY1062869.1 MG2 domain-containing protein [Nannocystis sp. SCPEA4]